jgi:hypothetical protein
MNKVDVTHILVFGYPHGLYEGLRQDKLDDMFAWCLENVVPTGWEYIYPESDFSPRGHYFCFKDGAIATMFALKFN